ncbi:MAG: histidine kinase [Chloracidobacterium sp. CP2_5A]|nr:MAG: histidine kinase [Chloracidobacterium sp. CP2_5A]
MLKQRRTLRNMSLERIIRDWKVRHLEPSRPVIVAPETSLAETIKAMMAERAGYAFVGEEGRLLGIVTERDYLLKVIGLGVSYDAPAKSVMTPNPTVIHEDATIVEAMRLMDAGNYRHLPVLDTDGGILGVISTRHIISFIVEHFPQDVVNLPPKLDQKSLTVEGG